MSGKEKAKSQWLHTCSKQELHSSKAVMWHPGIRPIAQPSNKQDKDRHHRCSKFVNSFSGPVKLLQTQMFKRNYKISISIPQFFFPESLFSRLVKRHLKLSDPCQSVKLTDKVLWSLSLWKSPGKTPEHLLFPGFMLCLRNTFDDTKQFCANLQLWKHQNPLKQSEKKTPLIIYCFLSPSIAQNREHT